MKNRYFIKEKKIGIFINSKYGNCVTYIDIEDFDLVNQFRTTWSINVNKSGRIDGVRTKIHKNKKHTQIWLHRLIMNCPENFIVDHIDGDVLNNCKDNLRIITANENNSNLYNHNKKSTTGELCIYYEKNKFKVRIQRKYYGQFNTLEEAIIKRDSVIFDYYPLRINRNLNK